MRCSERLRAVTAAALTASLRSPPATFPQRLRQPSAVAELGVVRRFYAHLSTMALRILAAASLVVLAAIAGFFAFWGIMITSGGDGFSVGVSLVGWVVAFIPSLYLLFAAGCFLFRRAGPPVRVTHYIICGIAVLALVAARGFYLAPIPIAICVLWALTTDTTKVPQHLSAHEQPRKPGAYNY